MSEVGFYHLERTSLERALPKLLEKVLAAGMRAVVLAGSEEQVEALNAALWTYDPASFLAHGSAADDHAEDQPIYLTAKEEAPNGAQVLVLVDGVRPAFLADFRRCLDLFDGNDPAAVHAARERWSALKDAGHTLTYWQQTPQGTWGRRA